MNTKAKTKEPSQAEVAALIADRLGEIEFTPRASIVQIVKQLGRTQALAILAKTLEVEEQGGMVLPDGSRRRTPGGVFFHLVYTTSVAKKTGEPLERPEWKKKPRKNKGTPVLPAKQPQPTFKWDDRVDAIQEAFELKGNATVKMTLIGRPGKIVDRGSCIVTVMTSSKIPALPKGLPAPTTNVTKYAVYISSKQWKSVAQVVDDPEDVLIVEGFPCADKEVTAIAVFATSCTTKKLQAAKRQTHA